MGMPMTEEDEATFAAQLMEALGNGALELADLARSVDRTPDALASELARLAPVPPKVPSARMVVAEYEAARALRPARSAAAGDDVEARAHYLQTFGLRNQWYVVAASAEVGQAPVGVKRCGEALVL